MEKLNIKEKIAGIIDALNKTNYEMFDGDKDEAMDFLELQLKSFPAYANTVIMEQIMMPIWQNRFEGEELRDKIQSIDARRRCEHENAISSVNVLNRLSKNLGLPLFADIDTNDRYVVADFIGEAVNEIYNNGIGKTIDSATYNKEKQYNLSIISAELKKLDANHAAINHESQDLNGPTL